MYVHLETRTLYKNGGSLVHAQTTHVAWSSDPARLFLTRLAEMVTDTE